MNNDDKLGKLWNKLIVSYNDIISYNSSVYMEESHEYPEFVQSGSSQHNQIQNNKVPVTTAKFNNSRIVIRSHKFPMTGISAYLYLIHN